MSSFITIKNGLNICLFFFLLFTANNAFSNELFDADKQLKTADNIRSKNPAQFKKIINELSSNKKALSTEQAHYLNYLIAYQQSISGELQKSIKIYKSIINSNASIELKFRANSSIINTFAITQNWTEGLLYLSRNFELLDQLSNIQVKQNGLIVSALFYNLMGQYELGHHYALSVLAATKNDRALCLANQLILEARFKLKQIDTDDIKINQAIDLCLQEKEIIMASAIRTYLAKLHMDNGDTLQAKKLLLQTLSLIEDTNYTPVIAEYYSLLAEIYYKENNFYSSAEYANKTLIKTRALGNSKPLILGHSLLYKIELQNNSPKKALDHYIKYAEANQAHLENEKAKHLAFQLAEHKELEQKNHIEFLNKKNALLTAEQALTKANAENTRFIMIILAMSLTVLIFWGVRLLRAHKRIKQLAEYDALTGIFNRGHFTQVANNALRYCESAEQELSLIMFDLDYFKNVNDKYGHACGDWALKKTIEVCQTIGRQNDIFARLGGEEFCLLLTSCDKQAALQRAEACRKAIAEISTAESGFDFTITASFGVTDAKTSGYELEKLLADSDSAAYASKHAGRNQVTVFEVKKTEESNGEKPLDNSWNIDP